MDLGLCSKNQAQNEARSVQRAGQTVSSLLLSAAGPAARHCTSEQVLQTRTCARREFSVEVFDNIFSNIFGRFIHVIMVFWSFLAGVVTFYCSLGPESLLPNIFGSMKPKAKVARSGTAQCTCQT